MSNVLSIHHINQVIEIRYTDPEWRKERQSVGTLEGFNMAGGTYEWWMEGNPTRYTSHAIEVRTLHETQNAWMQPGVAA